MRNIQRYLVITSSGTLQYWAPANYQEALNILKANPTATLIDLATGEVMSGTTGGTQVSTPTSANYPLYQFVVLINQSSLTETAPEFNFWYSSFPDFPSAQARSDATVAMGQGYTAVVYDLVAGQQIYESVQPSPTPTPTTQLNKIRLGVGASTDHSLSPTPVTWGVAWQAAAPGSPFQLGVVGY